MSLVMNQGTWPAGLTVKTNGSGMVRFGDYEVAVEDFLVVAAYVLTNDDLVPDDPRLQFVKCVQSMKQVEGYNLGQKRLQHSEPPVRHKR